MIKAIIFDMDGVIVDSEPVHIKAEKQTMIKYGIDISTKELQKYTGTTAKFMFTELIKKYNLNTTFKKIFNEKEQILFKLLEKDICLTKGVISLIKNLKQKGIQLGIASSSHKKLINFIFKKLNITHFFDSIISAENIKHSKPNPEIFLKSSEDLGINPNNCLVIEDAELGVKAAKNAGMRCIGYKNPNSGNQDLSKADMVIDDFSKLTLDQIFLL